MSDDEARAALARRLGHELRDARLLEQALTHRSWTQEGSESASSYERLEFLGDAVLGLLATQWLYAHLDESDEGELSKLKSYVVSEPVLAAHARELGIGPLLPWRAASLSAVMRRLQVPAWAAAVTAALLALTGAGGVAVIVFGLAAFVATATVAEMVRGVQAQRRAHQLCWQVVHFGYVQGR